MPSADVECNSRLIRRNAAADQNLVKPFFRQLEVPTIFHIMIGAHDGLGFAVNIIVIPINPLIQILGVVPCRQICRFGYLCQAVTVDIHGIQGAEHGHLRGNTGSCGEHDVGQFPIAHGQNIGHGNALNFALNLLGCYVHDMRLQCLEFFGRFYSDGGKPFRPLAMETKYVDIHQ